MGGASDVGRVRFNVEQVNLRPRKFSPSGGKRFCELSRPLACPAGGQGSGLFLVEMLSLGSGGAKSNKPSFVSYVTPEVSDSGRVSIQS